MAGKSSEKIKCIFFSEFHITAGPKITFQLESSILSEESKKSQIPALLSDILNSLNQTGSCSLCLNSSCTVHLKVSPQIEDPKPVQDHDVPMFLSDFSRHIDVITMISVFQGPYQRRNS
ncbi:NPRL2-like protein [Mya arenaria]|uniref:NPRL2-like protein n=1 Tax=Mya arenaria TaxID=6604 RepID=A0ABY7DFG8_MYAAR|nr:NPRL2-like protein [Mya arenaria]